MSKRTHDITISAFLSIHAPLIYKQDPTPNPSFISKFDLACYKIDNYQLVQKLDYSPVGFYRRV
jgi:hypothetical protein